MIHLISLVGIHVLITSCFLWSLFTANFVSFFFFQLQVSSQHSLCFAFSIRYYMSFFRKSDCNFEKNFQSVPKLMTEKREYIKTDKTERKHIPRKGYKKTILITQKKAIADSRFNWDILIFREINMCNKKYTKICRYLLLMFSSDSLLLYFLICFTLLSSFIFFSCLNKLIASKVSPTRYKQAKLFFLTENVTSYVN